MNGSAVNFGGVIDNGTDIAFSRSGSNNSINLLQYICADVYERKMYSTIRLLGLRGAGAEPSKVDETYVEIKGVANGYHRVLGRTRQGVTCASPGNWVSAK